MSETLETITYVFGGGAAFLAAAAWLLRELFTHLLSKDIENFKETLRLTNEQRLSEFTHKLEKAKLEHEIRFSALHQLRFEKLNELHLKARKLSDLLYQAIRPKNDGREERFRAAKDAIWEAHNFLSDIELFLPKEFAERWSTALGEALRALDEFTSTSSWETSDFQADSKRLSDAVHQVINSIRTFQIQLVNHARELLEHGGIGPTPDHTA